MASESAAPVAMSEAERAKEIAQLKAGKTAAMIDADLAGKQGDADEQGRLARMAIACLRERLGA